MGNIQIIETHGKPITELYSNLKSFNIHFAIRCGICPVIPKIMYQIQNNKTKIETLCGCGHDKINSISIFNKEQNELLQNLKCKNCNFDSLDVTNPFYYCPRCNQLFCASCRSEHIHFLELVSLNYFDSTCIEHNKKFNYICLDCKCSCCVDCKDDYHIDHILSKINNQKLNQNIISQIENKINEMKNELNFNKNAIDGKIKELENKIIEIKDKFLIYSNEINEEITLFKNIIETYKNKEKEDDLNYEIIANVKNLLNFQPIKFNLETLKTIEQKYENKEFFNDYFPYLDNEKREEKNKDYVLQLEKSNAFNFESKFVNYSLMLKNDKLAISLDRDIRIYETESYSLQLIINELNTVFTFLTELKDERLVCLSQNFFTIIKFPSVKTYQIEQIIKDVYVSYIFELNNESLFACLKDSIHIYKKGKDNQFEDSLQTFDKKQNIVYAIQIKEKIIACISHSKRSIFFWDLEEDTILDIIKNISIFYSKNYCNTMILINENILAVCGSDCCGLILIDINSYQIIKSIPSYDNILGISKKIRNNVFITFEAINISPTIDNYKSFMREFVVDKNGINWNCVLIKQNVIKGEPTSIVEMKDDKLAVSLTDGTLIFLN